MDVATARTNRPEPPDPSQQNRSVTKLSSRLSQLSVKLPIPVRPFIYWTTTAAAIVPIEIFGRQSPGEVWDLLGVLAIAVWLRVTAEIPDAYVPWRNALVTLMRRRVQTIKAQLQHSIGIDLRGDTLPQARPVPSFQMVSRIGWLVLISVALASGALPEGLRQVLLSTSATVYFAGLGLLLVALVLGTFVALLVSFILIHDTLVRRRYGENAADRRRFTFLLTTLYFSSVLFGSVILGYPWGLAGAIGALILAQLYPTRPEGKPLIALAKNQSGEVFSIPFTSFLRQANTWIALGILILGLLAGGGRSPWDASTPITLLLGGVFLWATAPLLITILTRGLYLFWGQPFLGSPTEKRNNTIWILATEEQLQESGLEVDRLKQRLRVGLWDVVFSPVPPPSNAADLVFQVAGHARPADPAAAQTNSGDAPGAAPLPGETALIQVTLEDLADPQLVRRVNRWDLVWKRRRIHRRLRRLFKIAAARTYRKGTGFLFAPHYWFVNGLTRDEDEDGLSFEHSSDGCIGPPYRELFGIRLRRYLREVLDSVEVDIIYIEDGIGYRGLKRVLATVFEVYDIHGGKQRIEDHHFIGLPGLTVHLDDYGMNRDEETSSAPEGYPEPDYEGIGRARILVIQKNRGGNDEEEEVPETPESEEDWTWLKDALDGIAPMAPSMLGR